MSQYYSHEELSEMGFGSIGENIVIHRQTNIVFPERIHLGSNIRIDGFSTLLASGEIVIGNYVHISPYCHVAARGGVEFGDFSGISSGVRVYSTSDDYTGAAMTNPTVPAKFTNVKMARVVFGRHSIVGSNSVVLPGVVLHEGVAVGALSLVSKSLPEWGIYSGVPVKRIKARKRNILDLEQELMRA